MSLRLLPPPRTRVAALLLKYGISALPIVDCYGAAVGIISEGDLVRRAELNTEQPRRSWWLELLSNKSNETLAMEYVKSHAHTVGDIMTREVVTAVPETSLSEIAALLESNRIERSRSCKTAGWSELSAAPI